MNTTNVTVVAPKTVSADIKAPRSEAAVTPSIRFTCEAAIKMRNAIKSSPCCSDPIYGGKARRLPNGSVLELMKATQGLYDRALRAESKCRTNLSVGLAGGAVIGASITALLVFIVNRRKKRQQGNQ